MSDKITLFFSLIFGFVFSSSALANECILPSGKAKIQQLRGEIPLERKLSDRHPMIRSQDDLTFEFETHLTPNPDCTRIMIWNAVSYTNSKGEKISPNPPSRKDCLMSHPFRRKKGIGTCQEFDLIAKPDTDLPERIPSIYPTEDKDSFLAVHTTFMGGLLTREIRLKDGEIQILPPRFESIEDSLVELEQPQSDDLSSVHTGMDAPQPIETQPSIPSIPAGPEIGPAGGALMGIAHSQQ